METPDSRTGRQVLDTAAVLVTKIGGENAPDLPGNFRTTLDRRSKGKKQILAVSAMKSLDPAFTPYALPSVANPEGEEGGGTPGFNTTSHLIALARFLQEGNAEAASDCLTRVQHFTKDIVERQLRQDGCPREIIDRLRAVIDEMIARLHARTGRAEASQITSDDQDWLLRDQEGLLSITGFGEALSLAIYNEYFSLRGLSATPLEYDQTGDDGGERSQEPNTSEKRRTQSIARMRREMSAQIKEQLENADVLVAGGYLPVFGSERNYSDRTGALLAQAASETRQNVVYLVEKRDPISSADPRKSISNARVITEMSYGLALEAFGNIRGADGKAVDPQALAMLAHDNIDTLVLNSQDPVEGHITRIHRYESDRKGVEMVAAREMPVALRVQSTAMYGRPGFIEHMSHWFTSNKISIDQILTTEVTITFSFTNGGLKDKDIGAFRQYLAAEFGDQDLRLDVIRDKTIIFCLGHDLSGLETLSQVIEGLRAAGVPDVDAIVRSTRQVISCIIDRPLSDNVLHSLHRTCIA